MQGYSGDALMVTVIHSCSLSLLPFTRLELQNWGAVVVPAEPRAGVVPLRKALGIVMC